MNIAIDGHSGSGKSTIAQALAKKLGIHVFDTGALYRAIACEWQHQNLGEVKEEKLKKFANSFNLHVKFIDSMQHVYVEDRDYTSKLRQESISVLSSKLSSFPIIRDKILEIQRNYAYNNDCVMEGRDITSVVLPDADVKIFITADVNVRAERRVAQLKQQGMVASFDDVLKELKERDFRDENRKVAPLKKVEGATIVDTSNSALAESIDECLNIVMKTIKDK